MAKAQRAPIEYTVYTFDVPETPRKGETSWKRHFCSLDLNLAIAEAKNLLETRQFQKIEIKKKYFDPRSNRMMDTTCRVYEPSRRSGWARLLPFFDSHRLPI